MTSSGSKTRSAGIALYRTSQSGDTEVLLGRFGGPYWRNRDRAWGIPKGVYDPDQESAEDAARREFTEETGFDAPTSLTRLGSFEIGSSKTLDAFAAEGDVEVEAFEGDSFEMEWPPDSGRRQSFPELERVEWFSLKDAAKAVVQSQVPVVEALRELLGESTA